MLDLYKNIKKFRLSLGMTQTDLAKKLGYADKSMIAKIEKGQVDLPQSKIFSFAEALDTTASELMGSPEANIDEYSFLLANLAADSELLDYIQKLYSLNERNRHRVYGYIDSLLIK